MTTPTLQDRVIAYKCFELPGQPMYTHTGTSRLISDLYIAVEALTKERDEMRDKYLLGAKLVTDALQRLVDATKERDALFEIQRKLMISLDACYLDRESLAAAVKLAIGEMEYNQYAVADIAPHADVMAFCQAIAALKKAGGSMSLPPLPPSDRYDPAQCSDCYSSDKLREYGQQCREAALDRAAQVCDAYNGTSLTPSDCANEIRRMKS